MQGLGNSFSRSTLEKIVEIPRQKTAVNLGLKVRRAEQFPGAKERGTREISNPKEETGRKFQGQVKVRRTRQLGDEQRA